MLKNKKGFTLIEIIVVVVILAVLLAVAVPSVLKYINEADSAKFMTTSRAVNEEVSVYVNKKLIEGKRNNKDIDDTLNDLKKEMSFLTENKLADIISASAPEGYKIWNIDVCFDGVNTIIRDNGNVSIGWGYDANKEIHQITKIVIYYLNESDGNDMKAVVTLINDKMYYYNTFNEINNSIGKDEGAFNLS